MCRIAPLAGGPCALLVTVPRVTVLATGGRSGLGIMMGPQAVASGSPGGRLRRRPADSPAGPHWHSIFKFCHGHGHRDGGRRSMMIPGPLAKMQSRSRF